MIKTINKAYKLRIYPNKTQSELIDKTIGCSRFIYNYFLDYRINLYKNENKSISYVDMSNLCTKMKKTEEYSWLKEVDKFALQNSLRDLDLAYKKFFKRHNGFPKFKSKHECNFTYRTSFTNNNIQVLDDKIKLPKLRRVRFRDKRNLSSINKILNATISKSKSGKYYVSICVEECVSPKESTGNIIGIDLGLKEFAITSDGEFVNNPKYLRKSEEKLNKLQRSLSRKKKGSKNREKVRLKFAKRHEKITNQRKYFLHQVSTRLINENQVISLETLKVKNMLKNHNLAKSISDVSWYEFTRQLEYKGLWNNRNVVKIDSFYPSSQLCSNCGNKSKQTKDLSCREYVCKECGISINRDINASINIMKEGFRMLLSE